MIKTGILGGTFDPVHKGHMSLAANAYRQCRLDEVWFMPSPQPPHKTKKIISDYKFRYDMTQLAVKNHPEYRISDFETKLEGKSYTARTLAELQKAFPEREFYFIIGADSLYEIETWYHPEEIMKRTTLIVAVREYDTDVSIEDRCDYLRDRYGAKIILLKSEEIDISSSDIRKMISEGKDVSDLVPDGVSEYIKERGMYGEN